MEHITVPRWVIAAFALPVSMNAAVAIWWAADFSRRISYMETFQSEAKASTAQATSSLTDLSTRLAKLELRLELFDRTLTRVDSRVGEMLENK